MLESDSNFNDVFTELNIASTASNAYNVDKLNNKIKQGKLAIVCKKWLKKTATTRLFEANDLEKWSIEEMSLKFFSVRQSQMNRMIKAYNHTTWADSDTNLVTNFLNKCTEEEESGKQVSRSIDNFNKYVKGLNADETEEVNATIPTIFTMSFKIQAVDQNATRNIAFRVNEQNEIFTQNSREELIKCVHFLNTCIARQEFDIPLADLPTPSALGLLETESVLANEEEHLVINNANS
jgi:hypothetical protein